MTSTNMTCYVTNEPLSRDALALHRQVLDKLGWGPKRVVENEYGEEEEVVQFIDWFKDHLKHRNVDVDFSRHARLSTQAANMPRIEDFEDALYRARNFQLTHILTLTDACYTDQKYRERFMENPCFDGTINYLDQATNFFVAKYHALQDTFTNILNVFRRASTKEEYLHVFDQMLDLRYGKENRRPAMTPWACSPKAQIHPDDSGQFENQTE